MLSSFLAMSIKVLPSGIVTRTVFGGSGVEEDAVLDDVPCELAEAGPPEL